MGILLAFAPFLVFYVVERLIGIPAGLMAATLTSAVLLIRDAVSRRKTIKILEIGTLLLFAGLTAYTLTMATPWSIPALRLWIDGGLLMIVLLSIVARRPFTLQYAREKVPPEFWKRPEFVRVNYRITWVWAGAFALMVAADLLMLLVPTTPAVVAILITVLAIWGAARFTSWYPDRAVANQVRPAPEPEEPGRSLS